MFSKNILNTKYIKYKTYQTPKFKDNTEKNILKIKIRIICNARCNKIQSKPTNIFFK